MATINKKPSSPRRWLDSQTGITGSTASSLAGDWRYDGWRLSKTDPKDLPLPFNGLRVTGMVTKVASPTMPSGYYIPNGLDGSAPYTNPLFASSSQQPTQIDLAQNKSWDKLMEAVKGDTSALAVNAAEGRESFEMIAKRVTGLYRAYKALRKGDFKQFLKELSTDPKRKHRSRVRTASNEASALWLEYWFGWSPTVQDIGSAAMALSVNPVLASVRERATSGFVLDDRTVNIGTSLARRRITQGGKGIVRQGATFTLTNENLFLFNRLGLINPMAIAWELVPFSFVVDWFTKFGGYLESFTDLAGLEVDKPWSVRYAKCHQSGVYYRNGQEPFGCRAVWEQHFTRRTTTLLKPVPVTPRLVNFGDSVTRAATAVSLLNVLFLQGKR